LISLILYVVARKRGSVALVVASILAFALGLLSKEVAAVVPLLVLLLEFGPFESLTAFHSERGKSAAELRRRAAVVSLLYFVILILYLVARQSVLGTGGAANRPIAPGALGVVALPLSILLGYVQKVLFPVVLTAEFLVPVPRAMVEPRTLMGLFVLGAMLYTAWRFRSRPTIVLGMGLFLFGVAPVLHIVPIAQLAAERFLYLPSLGVCLILGDLVTSSLLVSWPALRSLAGSWTRSAWSMARPLALLIAIGTSVTILAGTAKTVVRNNDWESNERLFSTTADQVPDSPRMLVQSGSMAQQRGDIDEAILAYESALRLAPNFAIPHWNLALIFLQQGDTERARPHLLKAAEGGADFRAAYYHLARIELSAGNTSQAKAYANQFLQLYETDDVFRQEAAAIAAGETVRD